MKRRGLDCAQREEEEVLQQDGLGGEKVAVAFCGVCVVEACLVGGRAVGVFREVEGREWWRGKVGCGGGRGFFDAGPG